MYVAVPPIMEGTPAFEQITPHEHVQERFVEQGVKVIVPPIVEGIAADVQITPHEPVRGRMVVQRVIVAVPPIVEGIPAFDQVTPHEHVQKRIVEQCAIVVVPPLATQGTNHPGSTDVDESSYAFLIWTRSERCKGILKSTETGPLTELWVYRL